METAEKTIESTEEVGEVSMSPSTSLLACTDDMLQAAVNKAVENGLLPKAGLCEVIAENWRRMEECVNAALQANRILTNT